MGILSKLKQSSLPAAMIRTLAVPPVFHSARFLNDQIFLVELNNPRFRPLFFAPGLSFLRRALRYLSQLYRREFNNYAMIRYADFQRRHYSTEGRGYFSYANMAEAEKIKLYGYPKGRLESFIDGYERILNYRNGDQFFDCGAGRGQNVKILLERFDRSNVQALDISTEALSVIDLATKGKRVKTISGDITDLSVLAAVPTKSFDHAIISHVFSLLLQPGLKATKKTRANVVAELLRVTRKSVLIIDDPSAFSRDEKFIIEQWDRGAFAEPIAAYFPTEGGRTYHLEAGQSSGLLFVWD
tara:strand:+ start:25878 stop:26774 length:897 start_codon:yes stop_codon:yes gene_type:complete